MNVLSFCRRINTVETIQGNSIVHVSQLDISNLHIQPHTLQAIILDDPEIIESIQEYVDKKVLMTIPIICLLEKDADAIQIRHCLNCGASDFCLEPYTDLKNIIMKANQKIEDYIELAEEGVNRLRKSLSVSIPHEFNTPLTSVLGIASMLAKEDNLDPAVVKNLSRKILESINRLRTLIDNFVYHSYLQIKLASANETACARLFHLQNPDEVIKMAIHKIQYLYQRKISFNIVRESVICSETNFYKLIFHLLENALKFSGNNSVVSVDTMTVNNEYQIRIFNTDSGFSPEQIKMIGPFTQFDRDVNEQQGLGMGLAIVKSILKLYDGHIQIKTEKNKFTEILVYLKVYHPRKKNNRINIDLQGGFNNEQFFFNKQN